MLAASGLALRTTQGHLTVSRANTLAALKVKGSLFEMLLLLHDVVIVSSVSVEIGASGITIMHAVSSLSIARLTFVCSFILRANKVVQFHLAKACWI